MRRPIKYMAVMVVILLVGTGIVTRAQSPRPGTLDPTFGTNGLATTTVPQTYLARWVATQNVPLSDGTWEEMIVAVGSDWTIARHRANGAIDATFKNDPKSRTGGAFTDTFSYGGGNTLYGGLVVQPDNKILVAGRVPISKKVGGSQLWAMAVARYQANGRDDATFGSNGLVTLTGLGTSYSMRCIALQPDGKIIVGGGWPPPSYDSLIVVRLMPNGSLDTTFGAGGVFQYTYSPGVHIEPLAVAVQTVLNDAGEPEARTVITGTIAEGVGYHHNAAFLLRLTRDAIGSGLDVTFGTGGVARSEVPGADSTYYRDITCDSRNRIVAGGTTTYGLNSPPITSDMVVARFLEDGAPDSTFNDSGIFTKRWAEGSNIYGIAVQPEDKILAVGMIPYPGLAAVWRIGTDGLLDASGFGSGGLATTVGQFWDITLVHKPGGPDTFVTAGRAYPTKGGNSAGLWALWRYFY